MAAIFSLTLEDSAVDGDRLSAEISDSGELYICVFAFDGVADWCTSSKDKMRQLRDLLDKAINEC